MLPLPPRSPGACWSAGAGTTVFTAKALRPTTSTRSPSTNIADTPWRMWAARGSVDTTPAVWPAAGTTRVVTRRGAPRLLDTVKMWRPSGAALTTSASSTPATWLLVPV